LGCGAVEPEGEGNAIIKQEIGGAGDERVARQLWAVEGTDRAVAEERAQIGLMRGSLGDGDLFALQALRRGVDAAGAAFACKTGGCVIVAIGEVDELQGAGADDM